MGITSRDYTGNCGEELNMWTHMVQNWATLEETADGDMYVNMGGGGNLHTGLC